MEFTDHALDAFCTDAVQSVRGYQKSGDFAFFCCDVVYNMELEEAAECAEMVGAKHNIPYHMTATTDGRHFNRELAEQLEAKNRLIVEDGEEILVE